MSQTEAGPQAQVCPACNAKVDVGNAEPLSRISCPSCGQKIRVEGAFDNFVLVETLGVGGMGSVYKARDTTSDRFVALKVLRQAGEAGHSVRWQQQARITAAVNDPHVVKVFSFGSDHGRFYVVMELVEHGTLDDLIAQHQRLPEKQVLEIAIQVASGLQAALGIGLIHRDVKPANILFADSQTAKIVDFGLAGAAEAKDGTIWGTPHYVAPERLKNEREDFRSDIYGLGATLFHALVGRPPIKDETNSALKLRELKNQPIDLRGVAPDVSRETANIVERMLAPEPGARFSSYQELIEELRRAAGKGERRASKSLQHAFIFTGSVVVAAVLISSVLIFSGSVGRTDLSEKEKAGSASQQPIRAEILENESRAWSAALANHHKQIALYNFVAAHDLIAALQLSDSLLRQNQENALKKAKWLIEWKKQLVGDLNRAHFSGMLFDTNAVKYVGVAGATSRQLLLKTDSGNVNVPWTKLSPPTLLIIASSFIKPDAADAAYRQWLCAVFASETNQAGVARQLAQTAAGAKPEYAAELPLINR